MGNHCGELTVLYLSISVIGDPIDLSWVIIVDHSNETEAEGCKRYARLDGL
jgi:hypothetical protein